MDAHRPRGVPGLAGGGVAVRDVGGGGKAVPLVLSVGVSIAALVFLVVAVALRLVAGGAKAPRDSRRTPF